MIMWCCVFSKMWSKSTKKEVRRSQKKKPHCVSQAGRLHLLKWSPEGSIQLLLGEERIRAACSQGLWHFASTAGGKGLEPALHPATRGRSRWCGLCFFICGLLMISLRLVWFGSLMKGGVGRSRNRDYRHSLKSLLFVARTPFFWLLLPAAQEAENRKCFGSFSWTFQSSWWTVGRWIASTAQ